MWTRKLLKDNAKKSLKNYYWMALAVCVVSSMLGGSSDPTSGGGGNSGLPSETTEKFKQLLESENAEEVIAVLVGVFVATIFISIFALAIGFAVYAFLGAPIEAGKCKFFLKAREGDVSFGHLFDNFGSGKYMSTVKTLFFRYLYTYLWSLLFVIPGVVKGLEYYLIPYLIAENPNLSKERAFEISKRTMYGEKWKLFVLELSFIGLELLGLVFCCVGIVFVVPYEQATFTEFYACMRAKAIAMGITSEEELTGMPAINTYNEPSAIPYNQDNNPYNM